MQALSSTSSVALAVVNGLVGLQLAPESRWATLPVSSFVLGAALSTFFASLLMARVGRRRGFQVGAIIGMSGALLATLAASQGLFWLLCLSSAIIGAYSAFAGYYRFAAAEAAPEGWRERAISWVLAAGVVGAIAGPESTKWTKQLLPQSFAGTYLSLAALAALALLLSTQLTLTGHGSARHMRLSGAWKQLLRVEVATAVSAAVVGYAVMLFVMTATPIAMKHHQHSYSDTAWVIEWHVLGMFAPSFVTGALIKRFGVYRIILSGALMMLLCLAINTIGVSFGHFWTALLLLGVGWNFMFVGGTALLAQSCSTEEQPAVQGLNEVLVFGSNALASVVAGLALHNMGWRLMSTLAVPVMLLPITLCVLSGRQARSRQAVNP